MNISTKIRSNMMTQPKGTWVTCVILILVFASMFVFLGYSSGYGKVIDGQVTFIRSSLATVMVADFQKDGGEWSFGYAVPFLVAGLFWFRRKELLQTIVKPAIVSGGILLLLGFLIYWAGYRGEQKYFGYAGGQILAMGCILWFLGWAWFRKVFWLWALLGMMWPWRFLIGQVSAPLQLIMVKTTTVVLKLFGVGAVASGSGILTDTKDPVTGQFINMDVDVACSGMRSLFAMVMIGLIFVFLRLKAEWKRWILMIFVPAVAIAGNFVRMLLLYGGSRMWGTEFAIGDGPMSGYHLLAGLAVFVVALVMLSAMSSILDGSLRLFNRRQVSRRQVGE